MAVNSFHSSERLKSKKLIQKVFASGRLIQVAPIRAKFILTDIPVDSPVQVLFTVSKRRFPHAVTRNRLKRQMREVYRNHRHSLETALSEENKQMVIAFIYEGMEPHPFEIIQRAISQLLVQLQRQSGSLQPDS